MFLDVATPKLNAPVVGNPWGYVIDGQLLDEPVREYHYHAHYARRLVSAVPSPVVLEIGGGFSGLAYQLMRNGTDVTYIGLDLPEAIFLQAYYLASTLPHLKIRTFPSAGVRITGEMLDEYDVILMPNFMLPQIDTGLVDLALNIRSLSEMPAETIAEYLAQLDRISRLFIFHENIYKGRTDDLHGITSSEFPDLKNVALVADSESRWPRHGRTSGYPCHEHLYLRRSSLERHANG
jgi:putative sugar O-methyltransferase